MSLVLKPLYTLLFKPSVTTLQTIASQEEGDWVLWFGHVFSAGRFFFSPAARVFYNSLVLSNDHRVSSQCNTRLRLLFLLIST